VKPDAIAARWRELREAGTALGRRSARETLEVLGRTLDGWRDPRSAWRRGLEAELPAATGFTRPVVREGLARGLEAWSGDALVSLYEHELGGLEGTGGEARGFDTTAVLLAGSIPMPTLLSLLAPLAMRSPVLAKRASRDPVTAGWWLRSLAETDAELARCADVLDFSGDDDSCVHALVAADCVVATGSDETVAAVAARVAPPRRFVGHGHAVSVAALAPPATRGAALDAAADGIALDVALWDQLGCLSPIAVYVVDADTAAADRVAESLARALADVETRLPRGAVDPAAAAVIAHERAEAEMRAATGRRVALHASADGRWTVVREDTAALRPAPLHRFVRVHPLPDASALLETLRPLADHLAGVALAGPGKPEPGALASALTTLGASRVCPPGALQAPPLGWPRGGRGVFTPLARIEV
jgi:hypothetical protein